MNEINLSNGGNPPYYPHQSDELRPSGDQSETDGFCAAMEGRMAEPNSELDADDEASGRLIAYARVSTQDQRLDLQLNALSAAGCEEVFTDHGVSGARGRRPGLDRMLQELRRGDTVVVFKLDRLGRSVVNLSNLLARFESEGVHFRSLSEGIDTTTMGGRLVYNLLSAIAEFQRDLIIENTVEGLRAAKQRGSQIGRPRSLTPSDAADARKRLRQPGARPADVAAHLGVSRSTLDRSIKRLTSDTAA
ncbi:recombinase family protein [Thalassobaculum sp. OXR-137]|uniref:recombinase family protein n=1 Tax=Thalassobaculum sp. OXR-137 TaxID=3100173 RepID=UPI002AC95ECC|nr:recombinase family protein [Thalassobaculum sp. OXR-137]WPZ34519.1 recombinase family protein [Thalassobaculum sp. OXR-137]